MVQLRERFNAKARKSSRPNKRSKRIHREDGQTEDAADPNSEIHIPKPKEVKEAERRERLRQELLKEQENSKLSSKKKKRLEKYIDKKLKKEGRVEILKKLATTQAELPSLLLQPSSTLGSQKTKTHKEIQDEQEDRGVRNAMTGKKRQRRIDSDEDSESNSSDEDGETSTVGRKTDRSGSNHPELGTSRESPVIIQDEDPIQLDPRIKQTSIGGALRRNEDGTVEAPVVVKRKAKGPKTTFKSWGTDKARVAVTCTRSESSFDSSDSANDSSEDESASESDKNQVELEDDTDTASGEEETTAEPIKKLGGFKDWALRQLSASKAYVAPPPSSNVVDQGSATEHAVTNSIERPSLPTMHGHGPLGESLQAPDTLVASQMLNPESNGEGGTKFARKKFVNVTRSDDVQTTRLQLPILAEEQAIVEAIRFNPVVVLCGSTGSGKTTQVPQFLYEAGFGCPDTDNPGMIGITQPRRVAAMSMSHRVGKELSLPDSKVAYQIRYDTTTSLSTVIKFMTDGVLLRELATDFTLSRYSVIIVDEAHERSVNTDILIGVLSRVVKLRGELWKEGKDDAKPLRLIIMSATLRVADFAENLSLFATPPPIINVEARQHPVTIHFARRTHTDYVLEAIKKTSKIHARLPPGGILIFLTGQNEISGVCKKLNARYGRKALEQRKRVRAAAARARQTLPEADVEPHPVARAIADVEVEDLEIEADGICLDDVDMDDGMPENDDPEALDTDDDDEDLKAIGIDAEDSETPMHILPLYSILPTSEQMKIFQEPPLDSRLVVVATNVAETSLTIPGIRYVVDCGRAKERCYDTSSGVQSFRINWISKASADQRAGRAGRTGPGHCYRLYSSAVFENYFEKFAVPEIVRMPVEGVVLQMKSMNIDVVSNFPFPTPPDRTSLRKAETLLTRLGALKPSRSFSTPQATTESKITDLGRAMALFPLSPRFARMLVSGRQHGCLPYVITIVAALSAGDPFLHEEHLATVDGGEEERNNFPDEEEEAKRSRRRAFFKSQALHSKLGRGASDAFRLLSVVGAYEYAGGGNKFCDEHFVRPKAMEEIHKLRVQLSNMVASNFPALDIGLTDKMQPPSDFQLKVIRQLLCSAFIDQVAVRKDVVQNTSLRGSKFASCRGVPYRAIGVNEDVFIHPSSVLYGQPPPEYIIFQDAVQANQLWLKNLTAINPHWLASLGKSTMCSFGKPQKNSTGVLMVIPHFGPDNWELPPVKQVDML